MAEPAKARSGVHGSSTWLRCSDYCCRVRGRRRRGCSSVLACFGLGRLLLITGMVVMEQWLMEKGAQAGRGGGMAVQDCSLHSSHSLLLLFGQ